MISVRKYSRVTRNSLLALLLLGLFIATHAFLHALQNHCIRISHSSTRIRAVHDIFDRTQSKLKGDNQSQLINTTGSSATLKSPSIPYVIQRIGRGNKKEIEELTRLCIDVFFNEQTIDRNSGAERVRTQRVTPWKAVQLAYLRNSQAGDILARNAFKKNQRVDIIVARRVLYDSYLTESKQNCVQDYDQIYNKDQLAVVDDQTKLVLGEIIGYCEVIEKNFGLGEMSSGKPVPYLANLSVSKSARQSGVGSKLLEVSEDVVRDWKAGHATMVLQVEEDNTDAIRFYKKRGWQFVYADPTCRRYDTSGFFLKESRITKYAMVKQIESNRGNRDDSSAGGEKTTMRLAADKLKKMWFVSR
ncbi:hypothetical protein ACHAXN_003011 [Cyclotella atomus]